MDNISVAMLPQEAWEAIVEELREVKETLRQNKIEEIKNQWLESTEARKMLGVSPKTWQTYRDERRIPFSQVGRKIYVRRGDIEEYLQRHSVGRAQ